MVIWMTLAGQAAEYLLATGGTFIVYFQINLYPSIHSYLVKNRKRDRFPYKRTRVLPALHQTISIYEKHYFHRMDN